MNDSPRTTTEEVFAQNLCNCTACLSIPLTVLELEIPRPLDGWGPLLERMDIRVSDDHLGRRSIPALAARRLIASRRREAEIAAEKAARRAEKLDARRPVVVGLPAIEGASPYESMVAAGAVLSPAQEFAGGRPRPRFLEEELAQGAAADAEKLAKAKERAAQRMKEDLR